MFDSLSEDDRFEPKRVVIGTRTPDGTVAFLKDALREEHLVSGTNSADTPVLGVYDPALDTGYVYENLDERSFEAADGRYVGPDGTDHGAAELPLERMHAFDAMWFAWNGFYPEATVYA